jgi:hypothetical protein
MGTCCGYWLLTSLEENLSNLNLQGCKNHSGNNHWYPVLAISRCSLDGLVESRVVFLTLVFQTHWVLYGL